MNRPIWLSVVEVIAVTGATIVAVFTLLELKDQSISQGQQMALLSRSVEELSRQAEASEAQLSEFREMSRIQSKFVVLSSLQPQFTFQNIAFDDAKDAITISYEFINMSGFPLAVDDSYNYSISDCPTGQPVASSSPTDFVIAQERVNDDSYTTVNPYTKQQISLSFDPAWEEYLSRLAPSMKAPFRISLYQFAWIENLEQFQEIFDKTGLDLTTTHYYRGQKLRLPVNARVISFDMFLAFDGDRLVVTDSCES